MTLSAQSNFVKCLCLMVHSFQNKEAEKESETDVNMTEVPLVYGPLRSFIDMDLQVDLDLECLSHMSVNIIFVSNVKINPVLLEFISTLVNLQKYKDEQEKYHQAIFACHGPIFSEKIQLVQALSSGYVNFIQEYDIMDACLFSSEIFLGN